MSAEAIAAHDKCNLAHCSVRFNALRHCERARMRASALVAHGFVDNNNTVLAARRACTIL